MKYIVAVAVSAAMFAASPAFAGGARGGGGLLGLGTIIAPITTAVSALNVNALNNVSVLSGNKTNVSTIVPISLKKNNILSGLLGGLGGSHGCGCN